MEVIIRADSSIKMGSGHVMRCLALAHSLRVKGANVSFVSRELTGNIIEHVESQGFVVYRLPGPSAQFTPEKNDSVHASWLGVGQYRDAEEMEAILSGLNRKIDWLIVDHYALDRKWEHRMRPYVRNIMVIDDLADRPHDCDILLDQNLYENMEHRYKGLLPSGCRQLLGPSFVLLRDEFHRARKLVKRDKEHVDRIMIFFGGSDPTNETTKTLEAIQRVHFSNIAVDVVVGKANPHQKQVKELCELIPNTTFHCQINYIAELMARSDFAIGAGGFSLWERCYLGLPSITVIVADNQIKTTEAADAAGATWNLGLSRNVTIPKLVYSIKEILRNTELRLEMAQRGWKLMGNDRVDIAELLVGKSKTIF